MNLDMILKDGIFLTPTGMYEGSLGVRDGKIVRFDSYDNLKSQYDTNNVINLENKTVFPGFIDSHIHLVQTGFQKINVDLSEAKSLQHLKELIRLEATKKKPGEWIIGMSFNNNNFTGEQRFPTKYDLDEAAPDNPVFITRVCTHLMAANSKTLQMASIDRDTIAPEGGEIDRNTDGEPVGILRRNAGDLVYEIIYTDRQMIKKAIRASLHYLKENGITTAHSMAIGVKNPEHYMNIMKAYEEALEEENNPVRVILGAEYAILDHLADNSIGFLQGNDYFKQGYIKFFTDGSYGSRTAFLNEPYEDEPENCGIAATSEKDLLSYTKKAHDLGYQCAIHALGDRALTRALDVLEKISENGKNPLRHRLVHASLAPERLIKRIKELGLSVDIQPNFVSSEAHWLESALGSRISDMYAWKTMKEHGIYQAAGSDSPVEPVNPFYGVRSAVTRQNWNNFPPEGFNAAEKLAIPDVIEMYTINGARQYFEENLKGSIEAGKFADLVVLSANPLRLKHTDELLKINVEKTFVNGRLVYAE